MVCCIGGPPRFLLSKIPFSKVFTKILSGVLNGFLNGALKSSETTPRPRLFALSGALGLLLNAVFLDILDNSFIGEIRDYRALVTG